MADIVNILQYKAVQELNFAKKILFLYLDAEPLEVVYSK